MAMGKKQGAWWLGNRRPAMRLPRSQSQENISGKDLTEQSGENFVPARARSGHEGDEQSGENWITSRAHSGHEGKEQSVACQAFYRTYSFQEGVC